MPLASTPAITSLIELSWEVCNKVGGIHTVVTSKAASMVQEYANYILIGPFFPSKAEKSFEEMPAPDYLKPIIDLLKGEGIEVHTGRWLIKGNPFTILIDFSSFASQRNNIKKALWDVFKLDSLYTEYFDVDEPLVWSWAAGRFVEEFIKVQGPVILQGHEWLSAGAILYAKMKNLPCATVFTTHATVLGRALASKQVDIYDGSSKIDAESAAKNMGPSVWAKFQLEKLCATNAHVFTTVSSITQMEAERFLGKRADVVLPNGLDMEKFPSLDECTLRHQVLRARMDFFLTFHFFPYAEFDLENTLVYFIAGRYEFHDKGIDVFIKSLAKLNARLKEQGSSKTIVVFFLVPANPKAIKSVIIENRAFFYDIKETLDDQFSVVKTRLTNAIVTGKSPKMSALLGDDAVDELKIKVRRFHKEGHAPLATHDLYDEQSDPILALLRTCGLSNAPTDPVKVVFYPIYLTGADGLLDMTYYEAILASDLGVFPSYYEPWGYTPLETSALSVSAVTTDASGFGAFVCPSCEDAKFPGVFVLSRVGKSEDAVVDELSETLFSYSQLSIHDRSRNRIAARKLAEGEDWKFFSKFYVQAHKLAVSRLQDAAGSAIK